VNQAKAQLYYTFAAQSGDKSAQMALGYRYWTGISTLEDCGRAVQWYEQASHQGECYAIRTQLLFLITFV
jgi:TPR repeat protein